MAGEPVTARRWRAAAVGAAAGVLLTLGVAGVKQRPAPAERCVDAT